MKAQKKKTSTASKTKKTPKKSTKKVVARTAHVRISGPGPASVAQLKRAEQGAGKDAHLVLVYSDMCGFCHQLRPAWTQAVKSLSGTVNILEIDTVALSSAPQGSSRLADSIKACPNYRGVPYIALSRPGTSAMIPYNGDRSAASIVQFSKSNKKS